MVGAAAVVVDVDHRQLMVGGDDVVGRVVRRRDLEHTGAHLRVDAFVRDDGQRLADTVKQNMKSATISLKKRRALVSIVKYLSGLTLYAVKIVFFPN